MMILEIKLLYDGTRDCFEYLPVSVANWWGCGYELAYSEAWGFSFKKGESTSTLSLGNRIDTGNINLFENFKKYHGLEIVKNTSSAYEALELIKKELFLKQPVAISLEMFWSPWLVEYQQVKGTFHYCLVIGLDDKSDSFICGDPTFYKQKEQLPFDHFINGYRAHVTFHLVDKEIEKFDWRKNIFNTVQKLLGKLNSTNVFNEMREFSESLEFLDFEEEMNVYNNTKGYGAAFTAPLFNNLRDISLGRMHYERFLNYIISFYDIKELMSFTESFKLMSSNWAAIRMLLMKGLLKYEDKNRQYDIKKKAALQIKEAANFEESIAEMLIDKVTPHMKKKINTSIKTVPNNTSKNDATNITFLDLSDYFNNNAFGSSMSFNCSADISELGHYFLTEGLPDDNIWTVNEMKFSFPIIKDILNDNISCDGQIIQVPKGYYNQIVLLGCGVLGIYYESLGIRYVDGKIEKIQIGFSAPYGGELLFGESIAWEGNIVFKKNNKAELEPKKKPILAKSYHLDNGKNIDSIILPTCPFIHIFAISLS
jgi:hypothetical protein